MWGTSWCNYIIKLDGVGPVDNRPSTDKLHQFVKNEEEKKRVWQIKNNKKKNDMWHVTRDTWHKTHDMRHVTYDMLWGVNLLSKLQLPSSSGLWFMIFWRLGGKGWLNELINE